MSDPNDAANAALTGYIKRIRQLGQLPEEIAPELATETDKAIRLQIQAGMTPDGTMWPLTADGRLALRDAAKALTVRAIGATVLCVLIGVEAMHHRGTARGGVRRQILPTKKAPQAFVHAFNRIAMRAFEKVMQP